MKHWLIPAITVLVVNLAGVGTGWSVNEWLDDNGGGAQGAAQTGPTQAEFDAQRCTAALEAAGEAAKAPPGEGLSGRFNVRPAVPQEITGAIDRYCH